jgi:hypothetical protein
VEAEFGRMNASESLYVAGASGGEAVDGSGNTEGDGAVKRGQIRLGLRGKHDALDQEGSW